LGQQACYTPGSWHDAAVRRALVLMITLVAGLAVAHVGPSKDDNNRYLKLTPHRDRVRFAYTVFFGEIPGLQTRPSIDTDRDGTISETEAQAFGNKVAAEVAAGLDVSVDGKQLKLQWAEVVVGMGSPSTRAGSFSIDMITQLCLEPDAKHHLLVRDRFKLTRPGETEVKIEDGPGIKLGTVKVGAIADAHHQFKFVGPGGPLMDDGIDLAFEVTDKAPAASSACTAPTGAPPGDDQRSLPTGLVIGAAAIIAFVLAAIVTWVRRKKR
jgi:hypothetical protein